MIAGGRGGGECRRPDNGFIVHVCPCIDLRYYSHTMRGYLDHASMKDNNRLLKLLLSYPKALEMTVYQ